MTETAARGVCRIDHYTDETGKDVVTFTPISGKKRDPLVKGVIHVEIGAMTPGGPVRRRVPLEFPFPEGSSVQRAFETFDDVAKAAFEDWKAKQEAAQSKIQPASALPLAGPNGKPILELIKGGKK